MHHLAYTNRLEELANVKRLAAHLSVEIDHGASEADFRRQFRDMLAEMRIDSAWPPNMRERFDTDASAMDYFWCRSMENPDLIVATEDDRQWLRAVNLENDIEVWRALDSKKMIAEFTDQHRGEEAAFARMLADMPSSIPYSGESALSQKRVEDLEKENKYIDYILRHEQELRDRNAEQRQFIDPSYVAAKLNKMVRKDCESIVAFK
jgi:hypothetical protein